MEGEAGGGSGRGVTGNKLADHDGFAGVATGEGGVGRAAEGEAADGGEAAGGEVVELGEGARGRAERDVAAQALARDDGSSDAFQAPAGGGQEYGRRRGAAERLSTHGIGEAAAFL